MLRLDILRRPGLVGAEMGVASLLDARLGVRVLLQCRVRLRDLGGG